MSIATFALKTDLENRKHLDICNFMFLLTLHVNIHLKY